MSPAPPTQRQLARPARGAGTRAALVVALAAAAIGAAVWALAPVSVPTVEPQASPARSEAPARALADLDIAAFRAPLWVAAPAPPSLPAPAAPLPPLKLQLLAVVREGETYKAMLYDPDADTILVGAPGEKLGAGGRTVERVTAEGVQIRDATGVRTLALRSDLAAGGGAP